MEVTQGLFINNREIGVSAFHEGTKVTMNDIIISHTLESQCATDEREEHQLSCVGSGAGSGLGSYAGAQIELNRFVISKNAYCGAQLAFGSDENYKVFLDAQQDVHGLKRRLCQKSFFRTGVIDVIGLGQRWFTFTKPKIRVEN